MSHGSDTGMPSWVRGFGWLLYLGAMVVAQGCGSQGGGQPPSSPGCEQDSDCPDGLYCAEHVCSTGCRVAPDTCPEGYTCDPATRGCLPEEARCSSDEDCQGPRAVCDPDSGRCVEVECLRDADCPGGGSRCNEQTHTCVPLEPLCTADADCPEGRWCDLSVPLGRCLEGCRGPDDCPEARPYCVEHRCLVCPDCPDPCSPADHGGARCPSGYFCDDGTHRCVRECRGDADCPGDDEICCTEEDLCRQRRCIHRCEPGGGLYSCPDGWFCDQGTGHCEACDCEDDSGCGFQGTICDGCRCVPGCRDDADCPTGQYCDLEASTCEAGCRSDDDCMVWEHCDVEHQCSPRPCVVDEDCPTVPEVFYCDPASNQCRPGCRSDRDCLDEGHVCEANRCVRGCSSNEDCPRDHVCDPTTYRCVPGCRDDDSEPDNSMDQATEIIVDLDGAFDAAGRVLCPGDEDWLRAELRPWESLSVTVQNPWGGNLVLELLDDAGVPLVSSDRVGAARQTVGLGLAELPATLFVRVREHPMEQPRSIPYRLSAQVSGVGPCPEDALEPNQVWYEPAYLEDGEHPSLTMCPRDEDWYTMEFTSGDEVLITMDYDVERGALGMEFMRPEPLGPVLLAMGEPSEDRAPGRQVVHVPEIFRTGPYLLHVFPVAQARLNVPYSLDVAPERRVPLCQEDRFGGNLDRRHAQYLDQELYDLHLDDLVLCAGTEDWYAIPTLAGDSIRVDMLHDPELGDLDMALYRGGAELQRSATPREVERLFLSGLDTDVYYLRVWGDHEAQNSYRLWIRVRLEQCLDDFYDPDDSIDAPIGLMCSESLDGLSVCVHDDDFFGVRVFRYGGLSARVERDPQVVGLGLELLDPGGGLVADGFESPEPGVDELVAHRLSPGPYVVHVYSLSGRPVRYSFGVDCWEEEPPCVPDPMEPNDDASLAHPLFRDPLDPEPWTMGDPLLCSDLRGFGDSWAECAGWVERECGGQALPEDCGQPIPCLDSDDAPAACVWLDAIRGLEGLCTPADAARVYRERCLRICSFQDEDWYQFQVDAGEYLDIRVRFMHFSGDLGAYLYCHGDDAVPVAMSDGTSSEEHILYRVEEDGVCKLLVAGAPIMETGSEYAVTIAPRCQADPYEPNETEEEAWPLQVPSRLDGVSCWSGDRDWFSFELPPGGGVEVQVWFDDQAGLATFLLSCSGPAPEGGWPVVSVVTEPGLSSAAVPPSPDPRSCTVVVRGQPAEGGGLDYHLVLSGGER